LGDFSCLFCSLFRFAVFCFFRQKVAQNGVKWQCVVYTVVDKSSFV
jgi:hypothetical protein